MALALSSKNPLQSKSAATGDLALRRYLVVSAPQK
jgi:hypothetical protein